MREVTKLTVCGLTYRVVFATADEVHHLEESEGFASLSTNTIYVREGMPKSRTRDALVHEIMHAFLEATGLGSFLKDNFRGSEEAFSNFEETLIRLTVPALIRLIEDNGAALMCVPKPLAKASASSVGAGKKAKKR